MLNLLSKPTNPQDALKGAQLHRGKTKARADALRGEVEAARQAVASLLAEEGAIVADSGVPATANKALQKAQDTLRQLEAGLTIAESRDQSALAALEEAQELVKEDEEERAIEQLKEACRKGDQLLEDLEKYIRDELAPALERARLAGGDDASANYLVKINQGFELFLLRACRQIIFKGRANVVLLKGQTLTTCVPDPSIVKERKRRGVTK